MRRRRHAPIGLLALVLLACRGAECPLPPTHAEPGVPPPRSVDPPCPQGVAALQVATFHGNRARHGWNPLERGLTPPRVASPLFGWLWDSEALDTELVDGEQYAPHLYASPLYLDDVDIAGGRFAGLRTSVVFAATSNAWVYAISACGRDLGDRHVAAGTILWRTRLGTPARIPRLDGGLPLGVLSTPVIDLQAAPPRLYVASVDAAAGWQLFALQVSSGQVLPGWPVTLSAAAVTAVNRNGPARFFDASVLSQRGALNLSPRGDVLYVPFGAYSDGGVGWMVAVDTAAPAVLAAFASAPSMEAEGNGGIWGPGGAAIDDDGRIYATTGNSPPDAAAAPGVFGESILSWQPPLTLAATYTPWNYCQLDQADADLGGSSPLLLPALDPLATATPRLIAFGGKQGNVYLLDRDHLPGRRDRRPPCGSDPAVDGSLLPPQPQPQLHARGPLNVFGPYSESDGNLDRAKMRSTPAYFSDGQAHFLFVSGTTKAQEHSTQDAAPALARLRVVTAPGQPAYLAIDRTAPAPILHNPGSPVVSSEGPNGVVVWVLDENAARTSSLLACDTPHPILYAFDGTTLEPLYQSPPGLLNLGGKYSTPVVAHWTVLVGTDRIQAFGIVPPLPFRELSSGDGRPGTTAMIITGAEGIRGS